MKRFLCVLTVLAVLFSCCACGGKTEDPTEAAAEGSSEIKELTNEDLYGHIDQFTPLAGVYKLWNAEGVKSIADHPEATFEILCNIDMEGAVLAPIQEFTGEIKGNDFTISNFTVQGDGENFGFIGVNKGSLRNLVLDQVTFVPGTNAKNIGAIAGSNEATILRCTVNGSLTVDQTAEGAACGTVAGTNTGSITNTKTTVDLYYNATAGATVGGIVGVTNGGTVEAITLNGRITVTNGSNKTVGLFAGEAADVVIKGSKFLGEDNSADGKLFTNFTGNADDNERETVTDARLRDNGREPLPENIRAVREKVVQAMADMGTIQWKVKQDLPYTDRVWSTTYTFIGIPYNHKSGSLAQAQYMIGEDGYLIDDVYSWNTSDSWDMYFGSDCSSALQQAWWTVSNSTNTLHTTSLYPIAGKGTIALGDWEWEFALSGSPVLSEEYILATDEQTMYEAYALLRAGDAYVYSKESGGHTRMAAEDAVVVRDQDGKIDPQESYVISHEQGYASRDDEAGTYTSWRIGYKYYFANLYIDWAVPFTCEELLTGELEPVEAKLEGGAEGYAGMFSGTVTTNYHLNSVTLKITDSEGNVVLEKPFFPDVQKNSGDFGNAYYTGRQLNTQFQMSEFGIFLTDVAFQLGESYNYTVTANLATYDDIVVSEGDFIYGS